jgi:hypothetical protein
MNCPGHRIFANSITVLRLQRAFASEQEGSRAAAIHGDPIPSILLFLSPRTTTIIFTFIHLNQQPSQRSPHSKFCVSIHGKSFSTTYQGIRIRWSLLPHLNYSPTHIQIPPVLYVASPLSDEAHRVIFGLPSLREVEVVFSEPHRDSDIGYDHGHELRGFRGAPPGKLVSIVIHSDANPVGDVLGAFRGVALPMSAVETLSAFKFCASYLWRPSHCSLSLSLHPHHSTRFSLNHPVNPAVHRQ